MTAKWLPELVELSSQAASVEDLHALCTRLCKALDLEYFIYGSRFSSSLVKPFMLIVSGYPTAWRDRYEEQGYLLTDPTVRHCMRHLRPLFWQELNSRERDEPELGRFMGEAREFGLCSGVSIPVHGSQGDSGLLSLCDPRRGRAVEASIAAATPYAHLLSAYIHEAALRVVANGRFPFKPEQLSERERDCLLWAAEGKTTWETARIVGIGERTVIYHLQKVVKKLNVRNRQQAIARAVAQGLIVPQLG